MKIGIISDSHDDLENVQKAIETFNQKRVTYVIHAGDYIFPGVIMEFSQLTTAKLIGVLGNNDCERREILNSFFEIDGVLKGEFGELELDGLKLAIYHGADQKLKDTLANSGKFDVFICGHTHHREIKKVRSNNEKSTLIINPGSAHRRVKSISGFFEEEAAIVIFDTKTHECEVLNL